MQIDESFGRSLKERRKALDMTQDELARRVGCALVTIKKIEADRLRPSKQIVDRLADVLQIPAQARVAFLQRARSENSVDQNAPALPVDENTLLPLPRGTLTFLFTDIEGSTRIWEQQPAAMRAALTRHDTLLREAITAQNGEIFKTVGDSFYAVFAHALDALKAAINAQRAIQAEEWQTVEPLRVRMALHTGVVEPANGDYFGPSLNRAARLLAVGAGGQVLLSLVTAELVRDTLPSGISLLDLGEHRLKDLTRPEHIFQVVIPTQSADFPSLRTLDRHRHNLPTQPTPLIGREQEVATVCTLLRRADVRLVTLTGFGGIGKTRLALQAAAEMLDDAADGVFFVSLASVSGADMVLPTIAQILDVRETEGRSLAVCLRDYARDKQMLFVLDNFEHVLAAADVVAELLATSPRLKILVTSRAILHLSGEHEFVVPALALPQLQHLPSLEHLPQYEAVALFIARAQAAKADFAITNANAPAVVEMCVRLDGLPLAIELAAARIRMFPPEMLLARLRQTPLPTLAHGARDLPTRQQTIKATIDWSYQLLGPSQQRLFCWLGVFVGGWTLEAAEVICAEEGLDVAVELQALVEHSLVWVVEPLTPRYTMLETIRAYALDRLLNSKENGIIHQRHAAYFVDRAEQAELLLKGAESLIIRTALLQELGNLRAVIAWSIASEQHAVAGMRLLAALLDFFRNEGYIQDAASWYHVLQTRVNETLPIRLRARVLWTGAYCLRILGEKHRAQTLYEASLDLFREAHDLSGCAEVLNHLAYMAHDDGDISRALALQTESLALAQQGADVWAMGWALLGLGQLARDRGDLIETQERYRASLRCFELIGHLWSIAVIRFFLADLLYRQGRLDAAMLAYQELLPLFATTETWGRYQPQTNVRLAQIAIVRGDLVTAERYAAVALELWRERGRGDTAETLRLFGMIALRANLYQQAEQYFQQSLSEATYMQETSDQLLAMRALSVIAGYQGNPSYAAQLLSEALRGFAAQGNTVYICWLIEQCASLGAILGRPEHAARLWGAAATLLAKTTNPVWDSDYIDVSELREQVHTTLTSEVFDAMWAAGQALTLEQAIAEALDIVNN